MSYVNGPFTANQTPLLQGGDFQTLDSTGVYTDANGHAICTLAGFQFTRMTDATADANTTVGTEIDVAYTIGVSAAGASPAIFSYGDDTGAQALIVFRVGSGDFLIRRFSDTFEQFYATVDEQYPPAFSTDDELRLIVTDNATSGIQNYDLRLNDVSISSGTFPAVDGTQWVAGFAGQNSGSGTLKSISVAGGVAAETLMLDQATATHGDVITGTSSILDGTSALIKDGSANTLSMVEFNNLTGGDYSFRIPPLAALLVGVVPGACTIELTNGSVTASAALTLAPLAGYTSITATTQALDLTIADIGYVGVGGLDSAITPGDIMWAQTIAGRTVNSDGSVTFDTGVFAGGTAVDWIQDTDDTLTWSQLTTTYAADGSVIETEIISLSIKDAVQSAITNATRAI